MKSSLPRVFAFTLTLLLLQGSHVRSDVVVAGSILEPKTPAEAWNVIRLATRNVDLLLSENRLAEIPVQISFCSPSLRLLGRSPTNPDTVTQLEDLTKRALVSVNAIASSAQQTNPGGVQSALASLRTTLDGIALQFDPKEVKGEIFFCPMHSDFVSESPAATCSKCHLRLIARQIPYSFIYTNPGDSTVTMTAATSNPIRAGHKLEVKVRMAKADGSPVLHEDLVETHSRHVDFLIQEPGLGDYHHENPVPTKTAGEYAFTFTPKKEVPYRIWADIVPANTGVQEVPFVDLPSAGEAGPIEDTENRFNSAAGDYQFALTFADGNHLPLKAKQARRMSIAITTPNGKGVTNLEPVMNAFAQLAGFYRDYGTVIRFAPNGSAVLNPALRGGPSLSFMFFPPKEGFIRLNCEVMIDGKMLVAPFNLNIQP